MKIHSRHLHAPLRGIFGPNSVSVAHYASFIGAKSPTKCDAQLTESNFQTRPSTALRRQLVLYHSYLRNAVPVLFMWGNTCHNCVLRSKDL
uniref:DUF6783 domain-containing protein n=1 Tax=Enterocloster aldenensis TaxID=358742 RepID=UPI003EBBF669